MRADVEALAAMVRDSAGEGERVAAEWVAGRLEEAGARDVHLEPYRYQGTYAWAHLIHVLAGLVAARRGGLGGAALAAAAAAGLELDASGRAQPLRRVLPASEGANVVARVRARDRARATFVFVAHHDAAHTGLYWRAVERGGGPGGRRRARRATPPLAGLVGATLAAAALGGALGLRRVRAAAGAQLALTAACLVDIARSPTVPGANDNATGVAGLIALAERFARDPLDGVDVVLAAVGAEEAGMGGMRAFLDDHRDELDPRTTFVLGLDTLGCGTPIVLRSEATILPHAYADADVALVEEGARRAGLDPPERWRLGGWTDPILARLRGLRAASLLSVGPRGKLTNYHVAEDTPDRVDYASVERCVAIAEGTARAFSAQAARAAA
jgi:hypothetical protein